MLTPEILQKLQLEQEKLDKFIWKNYQKRNNLATHDEKATFIRLKVALFVEIGELANELKTFKHWKNQKDINWEKVKEELIDCLHFYLGWVNSWEIDFADYRFKKLSPTSDYNELLLALFSETELFDLELLENNNFLSGIKIARNKAAFYRWLMIFEELSQKLGMNEKDIETSYLKKNKINWERQQNKY